MAMQKKIFTVIDDGSGGLTKEQFIKLMTGRGSAFLSIVEQAVRAEKDKKNEGGNSEIEINKKISTQKLEEVTPLSSPKERKSIDSSGSFTAAYNKKRGDSSKRETSPKQSKGDTSPKESRNGSKSTSPKPTRRDTSPKESRRGSNASVASSRRGSNASVASASTTASTPPGRGGK